MANGKTTKGRGHDSGRRSGNGAGVADWPEQVAAPSAHPRSKASRDLNNTQMDEPLYRRFGIDDENLEWRRRFLRLGEEERALLEQMAPWALSIAPSLAKEFYDWQFSFRPTRQFFEQYAKSRGVSLDVLRQQLEAAQAGYYSQVFSGAASNWNVEYFDRRLKVGAVHARINLPLKWYVGSYAEYERLTDQYLRKSPTDPETILKVRSAVSKVFNIDLQAIVESYMLNVAESLGGSLAMIRTKGDKMEHLGELRVVSDVVFRQLERLGKGDLATCEFDSLAVDLNLDEWNIGASVKNILATLRTLVAEINRMSEEHNKGDIDVVIPAEEFDGDFRVMAQGINDMVAAHIAVKKRAIACVAEFGKGNFEAPLEKFPGKKAFVNETIEQVRANLKQLINDTQTLAKAAAAGKLSTRADAGNHQGDFRKIVEGINQTLEVIIEPLRITSENASTLASSSEELTAVSQQMAGNAEETATQANVVSAASEEVSTNVASVASATEQMQASIREIAKNANESARVAKGAVTVAHSTNATVKKLGESSQEIGNVIKVITSIAQQTNLLALNATIEAARAGEAGKGFAVVANEVKELAKQTAKATEDIGRKIEAIQSDTKGAVTAIEEIGSIINQINDISNSIASAVEEQTVTTNEIGRSVTEAAKGVGDIARNISGVASAAKETTQGANDTQKAAQELSQMATQFHAIISRFVF